MIIIKKFIWRLGNHIIQLSNIIDIALYYKHNIIFKVNHRFFNVKNIENYFSKYNNKKILNDKYNFFFQSKLSYPKEIFYQNKEERIKILKKAFLIKNIKKIKETHLVVHIRSGDIFSSGWVHPDYVPPPLSYYIELINKSQYKKIIIVCEDDFNPVVNKLLKQYKNIVYKKKNLIKDIKILLGAQYVIYSVGTFVPSLIMLSNNIKNLYEKFNDNEYDKIMRPWKNTKKQRNYILTYTSNMNH